jgi:hypothetical protein
MKRAFQTVALTILVIGMGLAWYQLRQFRQHPIDLSKSFVQYSSLGADERHHLLQQGLEVIERTAYDRKGHDYVDDDDKTIALITAAPAVDAIESTQRAALFARLRPRDPKPVMHYCLSLLRDGDLKSQCKGLTAIWYYLLLYKQERDDLVNDISPPLLEFASTIHNPELAASSSAPFSYVARIHPEKGSVIFCHLLDVCEKHAQFIPTLLYAIDESGLRDPQLMARVSALKERHRSVPWIRE